MTAIATPITSGTGRSTIRMAVVGLGARAAWMLRLMAKADPAVRLAALVDPNADEARRRLSDTALPTVDRFAEFDDVEAFLRQGTDVDAIVVGTRCHLHTPVAVALADTGLPIFLEKPVAISWDQLAELRRAFADRDDGVVVSFPLRRTPLFETALEVVRSGRLGPINQVHAVNFVPYGAVYVENWYRDYALAGGLWLQKATHDFDYIHQLAGGQPLYVSAMHSQGVWRPPVLNQDGGAALIQYHHGVHASYTQNFLTRRSAGARGATVTGRDATLRFDWTRHEMVVTDHHEDRVDRTEIKLEEGHGGGDHRLAENFLDVVRGRAPSLTPLSDGLRSAATCLAARDAAHRRTVESIPPQTPLHYVSRSDTIDTTVIEPLTGDAST